MKESFLKKDIDKLFATNSNKWNERITFTIREIHDMTGVPISTINQLCREGKLKAFKIGRLYMIKRADLYSFIEEKIEDTIIL